MRLRRSGMRNMFATASKNFIFAYLETSQPLPHGHGSAFNRFLTVTAQKGLFTAQNHSLPITSPLPPDILIFSRADFENRWAFTVIFLVSSPEPSTLMPWPSFLIA